MLFDERLSLVDVGNGVNDKPDKLDRRGAGVEEGVLHKLEVLVRDASGFGLVHLQKWGEL